jgi:hypothetical protein
VPRSDKSVGANAISPAEGFGNQKTRWAASV